MSCWAGEGGGGGVHVDTLRAVNNGNVAPIPMLCVCGGGFPHLWEAHLSSDLWEGVWEQWEERKEGKWGGVCVWRRWRDGGDLEEYYHRTPHNDRPVDLRLTHLWVYKT